MSSAECVYYIIKRAKNQFYISNRPNGRKIRFGRANIAPRYTIIKIKKISLGRFFKIFLIVYSRIRHACLWALPTKTAFSYGAYAPMSALWCIRLGCYSKIKKSGKTRFVYFGSPSWTTFELYCCATMMK